MGLLLESVAVRGFDNGEPNKTFFEFSNVPFSLNIIVITKANTPLDLSFHARHDDVGRVDSCENAEYIFRLVMIF